MISPVTRRNCRRVSTCFPYPDLTESLRDALDRSVQITESGGREVLNVVDLPDPVPGDGQQLYEVSAAGVNSADTHHRLSRN